MPTAITSAIAFRTVAPKLPPIRKRVFLAILEGGDDGATVDEIMSRPDFEKVNLPSVSPRLAELVKIGAVEDSLKTRPTRAGVPAVVWVIPTKVRAAALAKLATKAKERT